jgi:hypothetical protein
MVDIIDTSFNVWHITQTWRTAIQELAKSLFSGKDEGLTQFQNIIADGKMIKQGKTVDEVNDPWGSNAEVRRTWAAKVLYSMLIPRAWYTSGRYPVVLDTGKDCESKGYLTGKMMSKDVGEKTGICHDGKLYYLVVLDWKWDARTTPPENCSPGRPGGEYVCLTPAKTVANFFKEPPGAGYLRNDLDRKVWGTLMFDEIIVG